MGYTYRYVNWSAAVMAEVPAGVVTLTSTVLEPGGVVTVICVSLLIVRSGTFVLSKPTAVAPVKPLPVITTVSPPALLPEFGFSPVTCGMAGAK
jgi:hypothetical protein